ncbi:hypothetical protein WJX82_001790 [Trebouxia sp. C0006]
MTEWTEDQDPYEVLGLTQGHESTETQIKKAYRLLALKKHPDKQPNNPNAAAEFHPIQRAFDLLSDAKARAALDDLYRAKAARKAREAGQSEKRRKMREDLEKREGAYQTARNDEQRARNKLKEELNRLRQKEVERRANHAAEVSLAFAQATAHSHQQQQYQADASASAAGHMPAGPFGFNAGSYSSFPGPPITADHAQAGFGQNSFAHTVQAGLKRAFEDATLLKLKQAADRARAIQQLQTEQPDQ